MLGTGSVDGYFMELNPAWEFWLGWTREELMAKPFISFVHPDDVAATLERGASFAGPGDTVVTFENRYRTRSGDYRSLHWTTVIDDGVLYFAAKDVTERNQAASMTKAITESLPQGLYVVDVTGAIRYANASALEMLGYEDGELIGLDGHATLHHKHRDGKPFPAEDSPLLAVRRTGLACEVPDDCFWRKDGSMLPVAYSSSPVPLSDGVGTVVLFRAIGAEQAAAAAREESDLAARRSEALHRTLTANLPDTSVFLLDHDLTVLVADGEAIRRLGWLGEDMFRGRKVAELYAEVPEEVLELCLHNYGLALEGERRAFEFESDGLTFAIQAVPVRAEDGTVESALVVARDVTARAEAERQVARRAGQQRAIAELGRFALESHNLGQLMHEAVTTAAATLGVDIAVVLQLDEGGESLTVAARWDCQPAMRAPGYRSRRARPPP